MIFQRLPIIALALIACALPLTAQTHSVKLALNKALGQAVLHGDAAKVQTLLRQGGSPNALISDPASTMGVPIAASVLEVAVKDNQPRIVQLLLEKGANVGGQNDIMPPLLLAVHLHHTGVVRLLLDHGANPNAPGMMGLTPLLDASGNGDTEIVRLLLAKKANVLAHDDEGLTALKMAISNGHGAIVAMLKAAGAKK